MSGRTRTVVGGRGLHDHAAAEVWAGPGRRRFAESAAGPLSVFLPLSLHLLLLFSLPHCHSPPSASPSFPPPPASLVPLGGGRPAATVTRRVPLERGRGCGRCVHSIDHGILTGRDPGALQPATPRRLRRVGAARTGLGGPAGAAGAMRLAASAKAPPARPEAKSPPGAGSGTGPAVRRSRWCQVLARRIRVLVAPGPLSRASESWCGSDEAVLPAQLRS